jgi:hypothetical protein
MNNLNLVGTTAVGTGASPGVVSTQSNVAGTIASCSAAAGVGDTHLTTFSGLRYDFQATGDFILAETEPDFLVQTRQVSGAPTWPNASVNKAIGTRMGNTRVSVCLPDRVEVNGRPTAIVEGRPLVLPDGVDVSRTGNAYLIRGQHGDSVRATVNNGWIDVQVGLGRWPSGVRGLLANPHGNVNELATREGTVLPVPVSFQDMYHRYGDSWRVKNGESLMCGPKVDGAIPSKPFYWTDLPPAVADRAHALCVKAGVKEGPNLDACTLDVAVIGPAAANVFVGAPNPAVVSR